MPPSNPRLSFAQTALAGSGDTDNHGVQMPWDDQGDERVTSAMHLAQVNIGRIKAPLDDPIMAGFVSRLDEINALAEATPGFVWRLQTDEGNATALRPYDDDRILVNLSVWRTMEELREFVYRSRHVELLRAREEWFEKFERPYAALWWIPAGHIPSVGEAKERLARLEEDGPTPFAFTFQQPFPPEAGLKALAASM
jgi:hypothetical protein